jgi:hypothetical protein
MVNDTGVKLTTGNRHAERLKGQGGIKTGGDGIANDPSGVSIKNCRQVDKDTPDTNVGDVGHQPGFLTAYLVNTALSRSRLPQHLTRPSLRDRKNLADMDGDFVPLQRA